MKVTFFKDIYSETPHHVGVQQVIDRIKDGTDEEAAYRVRTAPTKEEKQKAKKKLPVVCWTGKFNKRLDKSCTEHSGLICLDFDGFKSVESLNEFKAIVEADKFTFVSFVSPSGLGLKVLVKIPSVISEHKGYFRGLEQHYDCEYFDTTSQNPARLCFLTFDPDLYQNDDSDIFTNFIEEEITKQYTVSQVAIPINDDNEIIRRLKKWHKDKFPMASGQRNHNAFVLAKAFNEYGINKHTAAYVITSEYAESGFDGKEIEQLVNSAYKDGAAYGTKAFEDTKLKREAVIHVRNNNTEAAAELLQDNGVLDTTKVISELEIEASDWVFWSMNDDRVFIDDSEYLSFLQHNGFFKYYLDPDNPANVMFVRIENNLVKPSSVKKIRDFVHKYLRDTDVAPNVMNYFLRTIKLYKEDYLTSLLPVEIDFLKESKNESYLYYTNCIVKVTADNIETISYLDIDRYIWKATLLDRDYTPTSVDSDFDFNRFIHNVSKEGSRSESMKSALGFLTTTHKNKAFNPAIVLNDEVISDNPEGGTGKGIFCNAISSMRKSVTIDGKNWYIDKAFAWQTVELDTQVLVFDDIRKDFNFEKLFSIITEGMTVEKKNKDAICIPYMDTPKIAITTNYAVGGQGNSHDRRKFDLEFHQYYNKSYTPQDEFNRLLFDEWDEQDWSKFDAFMIDCIQLYLQNGLVESAYENLKVRRLGAATRHEFIEWLGLTKDSEDIDRIPLGQRLRVNELFISFTTDYPDFAERSKHSISRAKFKKWLQSYLKEFYPDGIIGRANYGNYIEISND